MNTHWSRYCTTASSPTAIGLKPSACCSSLQLQACSTLTHMRHSRMPMSWTRLCHPSADGDAPRQAPRQRRGHSMCIDEDAGRIFLCGWWDGERGPDDFGYIQLRNASATCQWSRGMTVQSGLVDPRATRWHSTRGRDAYICWAVLGLVMTA